jgi:hypothetical protein
MLFHGFWFACSWIDIAPATSREKDNSTILFLFYFYPSIPLLGLLFTLEKIRIKRRKKKAHFVFFFGCIVPSLQATDCDRLVDIWRAQCRRSGTDRYKT